MEDDDETPEDEDVEEFFDWDWTPTKKAVWPPATTTSFDELLPPPPLSSVSPSSMSIRISAAASLPPLPNWLRRRRPRRESSFRRFPALVKEEVVDEDDDEPIASALEDGGETGDRWSAGSGGLGGGRNHEMPRFRNSILSLRQSCLANLKMATERFEEE